MAVVGAGPAGLAAAWRLSESGRRVRVYEARAEAGGRLRTEVVGGVGADVAVQLLSGGYDRLRALATTLGQADRLVEVPGRDAVWRSGVAYELRYGSRSRMALSAAIPTGLKLRMGLHYVPFLERHGSVLDLNEPVRAAEAGLDGESIASWGRREVGEEFVERLVYPLLAAYYGVTPEETSAALFHALAHAGTHVTVLGARGGVGELAASMAAALVERGVELVRDRRITGLAADAEGVRVAWQGGGARHAAVVVAVPAGEAARLLELPAWLASLRTRPTASLVLALSAPLRPGWFGLSIPRIEPPGSEIAAICVQDEKGTGVVGPEGGALVVMPAPAVAEEWAVLDPRDVLERAMPAVERVLPEVRTRIREARLVRLPEGAFVPVPGHFDRLRQLDPGALPPGVALAGDYLVSPTVEGAVRSGLRAAERLASAGA